jgi:hypothetical protein
MMGVAILLYFNPLRVMSSYIQKACSLYQETISVKFTTAKFKWNIVYC